MNIIYIIIAVTSAYLLGSIPTAVWAGKVFHGIDVRDHGSGNAGATNVIRVLGWKTGVPVLLVDMVKGSLAALLPVFFHLAPQGSAFLTNLQIMTGLAAIIGHMYPVFAGFRGGKGVATAGGVILAIHPAVSLVCLGIFALVFIITGIVSVSSMTAGIAFPILLLTLFDTPSLIFKIFSVFIAVALLFSHRKNIKRLLTGEEKRLFKKKDK
ncbi:MAG: glycerol-3-phosphate 1-O-acyltransferase PlsY [Bacteroidia bacterium]|nr:glycerol-3-phosphate 1-O-acyltransferase PlsY [Bacteroidia bacterium]